MSPKHKRKIKKSLLGKKKSKTHRKNISTSHIGLKYPNRKNKKPFTKKQRKNMSIAHSGEKNYMYGKHHSNKTKKKLSLIFKDKKFPEERKIKMRGRTGSKSSNWKGGITKKELLIRQSAEYKLFRENVFKRDNYTCRKYGTKGGYLHVHHILNFHSYPELRFDVDNGITLSKKAHKEFHDKYGRKNNTLEQLEEFIK